MLSLEVDSTRARAFVRAKLGGFVATCLVALPLGVAILVIDYRFMIFSIVLFALPLIAGADGLRVRRLLGKGGSITLACGDEAVEIVIRQPPPNKPVAYRDERPPVSEQVLVPYRQLAAARVTPEMIALGAGPPAVPKLRLFIVPGPADATRAMGQYLASRGVAVSFERGVIGMVAAFLGAVILRRVLVVAAAGCAAGAIANILLAAIGSGGSYGTGAALLGAALAAMTSAAVLIRLFATVSTP